MKTEMKNELPYNVPEGYFASLTQRLSEVPSAAKAAAEKRRRNFRNVAIAVSSLAACLAAGLFIGKNIYEEKSVYTADNEMIIEYLVESGTTLSQIESYFEI